MLPVHEIMNNLYIASTMRLHVFIGVSKSSFTKKLFTFADYIKMIRMSGSEEEYYSTAFAALKHSIRRKIIRMLHEKLGSFFEMLDELKIESSHLTYHIETFGDLLYKTEDGKYALSFLGEVAMSMMCHMKEPLKLERAFQGRVLDGHHCSLSCLLYCSLFS